jgi:flagellar basal body-associated protein FliL
MNILDTKKFLQRKIFYIILTLLLVIGSTTIILLVSGNESKSVSNDTVKEPVKQSEQIQKVTLSFVGDLLDRKSTLSLSFPIRRNGRRVIYHAITFLFIA